MGTWLFFLRLTLDAIDWTTLEHDSNAADMMQMTGHDRWAWCDFKYHTDTLENYRLLFFFFLRYRRQQEIIEFHVKPLVLPHTLLNSTICSLYPFFFEPFFIFQSSSSSDGVSLSCPENFNQITTTTTNFSCHVSMITSRWNPKNVVVFVGAVLISVESF